MPKVMSRTARFDAADYLNTEKRQVAYLAAALESGDADFPRDAPGFVARTSPVFVLRDQAQLLGSNPMPSAEGVRNKPK